MDKNNIYFVMIQILRNILINLYKNVIKKEQIKNNKN